MKSKSSPGLRYTAYAICLVCCPAKIVAAAVGGSALTGMAAGLDYRLPLIAAGWTCIGLATYLMMRANREMALPAACRSRKTTD
jgi:hypothetical protein